MVSGARHRWCTDMFHLNLYSPLEPFVNYKSKGIYSIRYPPEESINQCTFATQLKLKLAGIISRD